MEASFVVNGQTLRLTKDLVTDRLKAVAPGRIQIPAVEIGGQLYPIKEAFAVATGLDLLDFNTNQARMAFKKLGFKVIRVGSAAGKNGSLTA